MHLAYASTFDSRDVKNWSGTPYYMSHAFSKQGMEVNYIGSLKRKLPPLFKTKQILKKYLLGERESPRFNTISAAFYSEQVKQQLANIAADVVVAPQIN